MIFMLYTCSTKAYTEQKQQAVDVRQHAHNSLLAPICTQENPYKHTTHTNATDSCGAVLTQQQQQQHTRPAFNSIMKCVYKYIYTYNNKNNNALLRALRPREMQKYIITYTSINIVHSIYSFIYMRHLSLYFVCIDIYITNIYKSSSVYNTYSTALVSLYHKQLCGLTREPLTVPRKLCASLWRGTDSRVYDFVSFGANDDNDNNDGATCCTPRDTM